MPEERAGGAPDVIELRGLQVVGICGALPEERERAQPLEIDLDVEADLAPRRRV
jgi:dihydroneopterin aldolase